MPLISDAITETGTAIRWACAAAPAHVWECLASLEHLHQWLGEPIEGDIAEGATFTIDHGDGLSRSTVDILDPGAELAYSWAFGDEPESQVVWRLVPDGEGTILSLEHTGLNGRAQSYRDGWITHLLYLEGASLGTPLPMSIFWSIHSIVSARSAGQR